MRSEEKTGYTRCVLLLRKEQTADSMLGSLLKQIVNVKERIREDI